MPKKCLVAYYVDNLGKTRWKCPKSMGVAITGPITAKHCWMYKCPGITPLPEIDLCKAPSCTEKTMSKKSLYCSRKCKSRESSRKHRLKKKNERSSPVQ